MRAGGFAFARAKELRIGSCDEIKQKALNFARHYLDADPTLVELRRTGLLSDRLENLAENSASRVIDQEWFRMGCRPGKEMMVLPPGFGRMRRRRRSF
jgi:hypothetical protein